MRLAVTSRLADPAGRYRLYGVVALLLLALACTAVGLRAWMLARDVNIIVSDARWYYAYLPSVIIDGDLDFTNQIREHWDIEYDPSLLEDRTPRGVVRNQFPIGLAVTLVPSFVGAHVLSRVTYFATGSACIAPDGYSLVYQLFCVITVMALGLGSMMMTDALLVRHFSLEPRAIAAAILVYWIGTHYLYYYFREPLMAHVVSTFWVTTVMYVSLAMTSVPRWWHVPLLITAVTMAIICRPTNVFVFPVLVYVIIACARRRGLNEVLDRWPLAILGLVPLFAQLFVWWALAGTGFGPSFFDARFDLTRPMLLHTLLSSNHGLFFWSPLLVLAVWGGVWYAREGGHRRAAGHRDPFWTSLLACAAILWYLNSARPDWWFGHAFGGRAFLELSFVFMAGLAMCFSHVQTSGRRYRGWVLAYTAASVIYSWILMVAYILERIPRQGPLL